MQGREKREWMWNRKKPGEKRRRMRRKRTNEKREKGKKVRITRQKTEEN